MFNTRFVTLQAMFNGREMFWLRVNPEIEHLETCNYEYKYDL